ncbi:hypothetical protein [Aliamphritea spongicola]|nr:hypothetical protein [Aliamphritea spongicola]
MLLSVKYKLFTAVVYAIALLPIRYLINSNILKEISNKNMIRTFIISSLVILPTHAINWGIHSSRQVYESESDFIKFESTECYAGCRFIGKLGGYIGVLNYKNETVMYRADTIGKITFMVNRIEFD